MLILAVGFLQRFGDMLVIGLVLIMAGFGSHYGLFLALLAAINALVALVVALTFAEPIAGLLTALEFPATYAFPTAFTTLLVGTAVAIRLAVGAFVPADTVRFTPAIDKGAGGLVGALAGLVIAGVVLIASSVLPLPEALHVDGSKLRFDAGTRLLRTFARCAESEDAARNLLVEGESPVPSGSGGGAACSELYADKNGNDAFDDGEPFLDADGNDRFTIQLPYVDANGNGRRDVGLVEAYRLGAWKNAKVLNAPVIDSPATVDVPADVKEGDVVYQIAAIDMDPGDTLTYGLRIDQQQPAAGAKGEEERSVNAIEYSDSDLLVIDKGTGAIKMADPQGFRGRKPKQLRVVVSVMDKHGLKAEKAVTLNRKAPK